MCSQLSSSVSFLKKTKSVLTVASERKTIRILGWLSSGRGIPQHCPSSTQFLLMTSVQEKLICCWREGPGLDTRSAEVKHISLLTRHHFSQGKKWKWSFTDTSHQNYKLTSSNRNVFHLPEPGLSFPSARPPLSWDVNVKALGWTSDFNGLISLILLLLCH